MENSHRNNIHNNLRESTFPSFSKQQQLQKFSNLSFMIFMKASKQTLRIPRWKEQGLMVANVESIFVRLLSPSSSPATSPTMSNSSSPTPPTPAAASYNQKMTGIPCVAAASRYTAPVHIDVGGTIYTSSLETLTK